MIRLLGIPANYQQICWEYQQTDYAVIRLQTDLFIQQTPDYSVVACPFQLACAIQNVQHPVQVTCFVSSSVPLHQLSQSSRISRISYIHLLSDYLRNSRLILRNRTKVTQSYTKFTGIEIHLQ